MRGDREKSQCSISEIIAAERFEKKLAYLRYDEYKQRRDWYRERRHKERVDAIEHNIKHENYVQTSRVKTYLDMVEKDKTLICYVEIVESQFRKAEKFTTLRGQLLGKLVKLKQEYHALQK